jgi:acyl carrier protein
MQDIQRLVVERLGTMYAPDEMITLKQLGLTEYPKTVSGKVQKTVLAPLVRKFRQSRSSKTSADGSGSDASNHAIVSATWTKVLGIPPKELDPNLSLFSLVDSIGAMRFRDAIRKETGVTFSMADLRDNDTVTSQVEYLEVQGVREPAQLQSLRSVRDGPPTAKDMIHTMYDESKMDATEHAVESVLAPCGLEWTDVEDVVPAYDLLNYGMISGGIDKVGWQMAMHIPGSNVAVCLFFFFDLREETYG